MVPILTLAASIFSARQVGANPLLAQQKISELPADELPAHAIWRIEGTEDRSNGNGIYRLQYSRDGRLLATRDRENVVSIYDVDLRKQLCEVSGHDNNWVETIDFSPDSKYFVTAAGASERVKIWNSQTGKLRLAIETDATGAYFSDDGEELIVLGPTEVERYAWPGGQKLSHHKWRTNSGQSVAMSKDGKRVVAFRAVKNPFYQTQIIDLENNSRIDLDGPRSIPKCAVISSNKVWLAAAYHPDAKIYLWDLRDPHKSKYILADHLERVQSLAFSPDNRFLISASWDRQVIAWDLLTRQSLHHFLGHTEHVNATACSPLDFTIATGATGKSDTSAIIWDLKDVLLLKGVGDSETFEQIWNGMGTSSIETSISSTMKLVRQDTQMMPQLVSRIREDISPEISADIDELISLLDDPKFAVREQATKKLEMIQGKAGAELRRMLAQTVSVEVRYRIRKILDGPVDRPRINFTDRRRWHRIILALELINTAKSKSILRDIAAGHPDIDISEDAETAIERNRIRDSF